MKKSSFLLIELLLVLMLLSTTLIPIIKSTLLLSRKEKTEKLFSEYERLSDLSYYLLLKKLYFEKPIFFEDIPKERDSYFTFLTTFDLLGSKIPVKASYSIYESDKEKKPSSYRLLKIEILLEHQTEKRYIYKIFAKNSD